MLSYWWLNAKPSRWSFSELGIGEVQNYDIGKKRRISSNFLDANPSSLVVTGI